MCIARALRIWKNAGWKEAEEEAEEVQREWV